jgi:hypothetical protein
MREIYTEGGRRAGRTAALSDELSAIIVKICDVISEEDKQIVTVLAGLKKADETLEKMAMQAEYKIRRRQVSKIRKEIFTILSRSKNKMVLATLPEFG